MALVSISGVLTSCSDKKEYIITREFPIPYLEGGEVITDEWDGKTGYRRIKFLMPRCALYVAD